MSRQTDQRLLTLQATKDAKVALAEAFFMAFGVSMTEIQAVIEKMASKMGSDEETIGMTALVATVQVRQNATFVQIPTLSASYPELVITSQRQGVSDMYNFTALILLGSGIAALAPDTKVSKMISKKGNVLTSSEFPDTPAGKIKKETKGSLDQADVASFISWASSDKASASRTFAVAVCKRLESARSMVAAGPTPPPATEEGEGEAAAGADGSE